MLTLKEAFNGMMPGYFGISHEFTGTSDHVMIEAGFKNVSCATGIVTAPNSAVLGLIPLQLVGAGIVVHITAVGK